MLAITGADFDGISEVNMALDLLLSLSEPDLTAMANLSFHKDELSERGSSVPRELPSVWFLLEQQERAEALAHSVPQPFQQALAFRFLIEVMIGSGRLSEAERVVRSVAFPYMQAQDLCSLAKAVYGTGDHERSMALIDEAQVIIEQMSNTYHRAWAAGSVAEACVVIGDIERAQAVVESIADAELRNQAARTTIEALAFAGEFDEAISLVRATSADSWSALSLAVIAKNVAAAHDSARAKSLCVDIERLASRMAENEERAEIAIALSEVFELVGDYSSAAAWRNEAEVATSGVEDSGREVQLLASLAQLSAGDLAKAKSLCARATDISYDISDPFVQSSSLIAVTKALIVVGDIDSAEAIVSSISTPYQQLEALRALLQELVLRGEKDRAIRVTDLIVGPDLRVKADCFASLARLFADASEPEAARDFALRAEAVSRLIGFHSYWTDRSALALVDALTIAGEFERAESLSDLCGRTDLMVSGLCTVASGRFQAGDANAALELVKKAEMVCRRSHNSDFLSHSLASVGQAAALVGDEELANRLVAEADSLIDRVDRENSLAAGMAVVFATLGDNERALECISQAEVDSPWGERGRPDLAAHDFLHFADIATQLGYRERAEALCVRVEDIAYLLTDHYERPQVLSALAQQLAKMKEFDRAELVITRIDDDEERSGARAVLVTELARVGNFERARTVAGTVTMPDDRAQVGSALAAFVEEDSARVLLAQAFRIGHWTIPLSTLARLYPSSLVEFADERISEFTEHRTFDPTEPLRGPVA
jgi:tetratricopeptide (TPR) repeat protein